MNPSENQSRNAILEAIRRSFNSDDETNSRRAAVRKRLSEPTANLVPARATRPGVDRMALLIDHLRSQLADVIVIDSNKDIPATITEFLRDNNLPPNIRLGEDLYWKDLPWNQFPTLELTTGPADARDQVSLARATSAAAETGTLFLVSGSENPTTNNFLPETHIVVLEKNDIEGPYEVVWSKLRKQYGGGQLPRTVNLISGPSRTADIEQTMALGAHGPRQLCVIIVKE